MEPKAPRGIQRFNLSFYIMCVFRYLKIQSTVQSQGIEQPLVTRSTIQKLNQETPEQLFRKVVIQNCLPWLLELWMLCQLYIKLDFTIPLCFSYHENKYISTLTKCFITWLHIRTVIHNIRLCSLLSISNTINFTKCSTSDCLIQT